MPLGLKYWEKNSMQEIERIQNMEKALNDLSEAQKNLSTALEEFTKHKEQLKELFDYYGSAAFHHDLELDETGALPPDLKRGVLSEDAVYDLMTDLFELMREMHQLADETTSSIGHSPRG